MFFQWQNKRYIVNYFLLGRPYFFMPLLHRPFALLSLFLFLLPFRKGLLEQVYSLKSDIKKSESFGKPEGSSTRRFTYWFYFLQDYGCCDGEGKVCGAEPGVSLFFLGGWGGEQLQITVCKKNRPRNFGGFIKIWENSYWRR